MLPPLLAKVSCLEISGAILSTTIRDSFAFVGTVMSSSMRDSSKELMRWGSVMWIVGAHLGVGL
ncbi:MAG: hypothetical protein SGPRY_003007 [Prymnesium sp.]